MSVNRRTATAMLLAAAIAPPAPAAAKSNSIKVPGRGLNIPDWLSGEQRAPSEAFLAELRARGFDSVRLPIDPAAVTPDSVPVVAAVLAMLGTHGLGAIIDMHPGSEPDPQQIDAAWAILAEAIAPTDPGLVYAELLNEPAMDADPWAVLAAQLSGTIRSRAPEHVLIWGPSRYQGIWELDNQRPPDVPNLIAAVHYYTPMGFTHQCADWTDSPLARMANLPFPATRRSPQVEALAATLDDTDLAFLDGELSEPWTVKRIDEDFAGLRRWSKANGIPVMLGEFGVLNACVDPVSRANWVRAVRLAAERNKAGWAYWEADQGFGIAADRTSAQGFDEPMIDALLG